MGRHDFSLFLLIDLLTKFGIMLGSILLDFQCLWNSFLMMFLTSMFNDFGIDVGVAFVTFWSQAAFAEPEGDFSENIELLV